MNIFYSLFSHLSSFNFNFQTVCMHKYMLMVSKEFVYMCFFLFSRVHRSRQEEHVQSKSDTLEKTGMTHRRLQETQLNFQCSKQDSEFKGHRSHYLGKKNKATVNLEKGHSVRPFLQQRADRHNITLFTPKSVCICSFFEKQINLLKIGV